MLSEKSRLQTIIKLIFYDVLLFNVTRDEYNDKCTVEEDGNP